jgi:RNA polymerase sigma-70 factor (ECF subfamily)
MQTDEELVTEYLAGNHVAFEVLVERHLKTAFTFVARYVGSERDAEDIVQESFVKAWKNIGRYHTGSASFKTWLMRIVRNTAIDFMRKRKEVAFSHVTDEEGESVFSEIADDTMNPEELLAEMADRKRLEAAIGELSPAHREAILLYIDNDLTFEEIAEVTEESVNTIKSRYRRAVAALRDLLHRD